MTPELVKLLDTLESIHLLVVDVAVTPAAATMSAEDRARLMTRAALLRGIIQDGGSKVKTA